MRTAKNSLLYKLRWTIWGLGIALFAIWLLVFINVREVIQKYTMDKMEQVSESMISELNDAFLQLEEMSFAMAENEIVKDFIMTDDNLQFHAKAIDVAGELSGLLDHSAIAENIIIFNDKGKFYRFSGTLSNVSVKKIMKRITQDNTATHIQITLNQTNYIGYLSSVYSENKVVGKIVMLIDESQLMYLFQQLRKEDNMKFSLAADEIILVSTDHSLQGEHVEEYLNKEPYRILKQVGFTPFELIISYEDTNNAINLYFIAAMIVMAILFLIAVRVFARFWSNKFFEPIQKVISDVEGLSGGKQETVSLTGLEHFDGLVRGINDMIERIEQKEKELYEAAFTMQESEIKKQRALIMSLKKQISAHFTINILNIITALATAGKNEQVGLLCNGLSYLLRYANAGDSFISGMDEFFVLQKYISIMEIRYPDRFQSDIDLEDFLEDIMIPRMLLQPIVENSIVHGFSESQLDRVGMLHIYSALEQEHIRIVIEDNGYGLEEESLQRLQKDINNVAYEDAVEVEGVTHVALINIQRRIWSYFGEGYGLEIQSSKDVGTKVIVTLPVKSK